MKQTKARIVAEGVGLLSKSGLAGVTLGVLATQTGMSKSGLFAHFKSKEEVQLQLLDETTRIAQATVIEPALKTPAGLKRLRLLFDRWLGWSEKAGLGGGCAVAGGFFELDDVPDADPVRQRLVAMELEFRNLLITIARDAVKQGELRADLDVSQFVWEMCGLYLNHHVSYRFIRDPRATRRAQRAFDELVRRSQTVKSAGMARQKKRRIKMSC
jgi:AcrR family transcriptional regulator